MDGENKWLKLFSCFTSFRKPLVDDEHFLKKSNEEHNGQPSILLERYTEKQSVEDSKEQFEIGIELEVDSAIIIDAGICASAQTLDSANSDGKAEKEMAAVRIQSAFRAFLARRARRALRGLVKLQAIARGKAVRKKASAETLQPLLTEDVDAYIHIAAVTQASNKSSNNIGEAVQQTLDQAKADWRSVSTRRWCSSRWTAETTQAKLQERKDAAIKRERAMAYALWSQWKLSVDKFNNELDKTQSSLEPSWLDRWMAARPWQNRGKYVRGIDELQNQFASKKNNTSLGKRHQCGEDREHARHSFQNITDNVPISTTKYHHRSHSNSNLRCNVGFHEASTQVDSKISSTEMFCEDVACFSFGGKTRKNLKIAIPKEHINITKPHYLAETNSAQRKRHAFTTQSQARTFHGDQNNVPLSSRLNAQQKLAKLRP